MAVDAFGNALGESMVEASRGDTARDSMTAKENFRRLEIEAMNEDARIANVLARSRPGISEENYWNQQASTLADRYADTYGGKAIRTSGGNHVEASSPYGQGWTDADGTRWLPEVTVTTNRDDGTYGIGNDAYGIRRPPGMPDNSPLQVIGESPDGGLIWNTDAVSDPVRASDIDMRPLADNLPSGTGLKLPEPDWQSDFMRGYRGEYRSVMEGPASTAETIGRYSGEVVDSFKRFGLSATGAGSMNAAMGNWKAGNYRTSALQTVQAFGEAGLTVFGFGVGSTARYGATMTAEELAAARATYGANSETTFSRIVPGGGLQAHEYAGGHLLLKHVGQSKQDLMTRLTNEPKISGSSSFYDRATAESAVSQVLDTNQIKIAEWLNGSSSRLQLNSSLSNPIGISVSRGATDAVDVGSARIILVRDPSMSLGYKILTGFPTKP